MSSMLALRVPSERFDGVGWLWMPWPWGSSHIRMLVINITIVITTKNEFYMSPNEPWMLMIFKVVNNCKAFIIYWVIDWWISLDSSTWHYMLYGYDFFLQILDPKISWDSYIPLSLVYIIYIYIYSLPSPQT